MNQRSSNEDSVRENVGWSRARLRTMGVTGLAAVGIYLCYRLAQPCIPSLVWAAALALVFFPLHRKIEGRFKRPNLAAAISLVIIGLLVVAPATWFAQQLAEQATTIPQSIEKQLAAGKWHIGADEHPQFARFLNLVERQVTLPENASIATTWVNTLLSRLIEQSAIVVVQVFLTLYFLFYFLRDRDRVLKSIRSVLPLSQKDLDVLFCRVNDTIQATFYGMLALSALQGVLGGLMYWWLGIPSPCFWALVMAVFAFVPVLDAIVLWLPAAVYLGLEGRWGEALGIAAVGTLLVRAIENCLYPVLVKDRLKVPAVPIFIAVLGGVLLFGWSGLVLGPVVLTLTQGLLDICIKRLGEPQLPTPNPGRSGPESLALSEQGRDRVNGAVGSPMTLGK